MSSHYRHWGKALLRGSLGAMLLCCAAVAGAQSSSQDAPELLGQSFDFDVPAQKVSTAILEIARQAQIQALMAGNVLDAYQAEGLNERLSLAEALDRVLSGTPYAYQQTGRNAIMVGTPEALQEQSTVAGQNTVGQRRPGIEEIIVTGQKREERIQDVPIAISAFTQEDLTTSQIAGGPDLHLQVPNMTFTKTNFTGYSIQIRGIGTQAISATTDPAVAVALNNTPFIRNTFFEQEFYDLERLEVLRGPQGTLYGRNATAGVVNLITAKPKFQEESMVSLDMGANYDSRRWEFMVNKPFADNQMAIRIAGAGTKRDGYATNELTGNPIDGRDLWSGRVSLRFAPTDGDFDLNLIYEHFEEDDDRIRSGKQLCTKDVVTELAGQSVTYFQPLASGAQALPFTWVNGMLSQGCKRGSLYSDNAFQTPTGLMIPYYNPLSAIFLPAALTDPYADSVQSKDLRVIESAVDPEYRAQADIAELQISYQLTDALTLDSETAYSKNSIFSLEDFNRFNSQPGAWNQPGGGGTARPGLIQEGEFGGIFCDPQLGCSDRLVVVDVSSAESSQFSQELRLSSQFAGPFDFSLGANFLRYDTVDKFYVFANSFTLSQAAFPTGASTGPWVPGVTDNEACLHDSLAPHDPTTIAQISEATCMYIDPNPIGSLNDQGHNYFLSKNPYKLKSYALFGETYWRFTDNLKLTAGLRWSVDKKEAPRIPSQLFAGNSVGHPTAEVIEQEWREPTGRLVLDWKPTLDFTDETLIYGSYSHGYKAGGANPPAYRIATRGQNRTANTLNQQSALKPKTFDAEFVDAFEIGTKNTLADGAVTLNLTAFYYDYEDYQISEIVDRAAFNKNYDAEVWGAELETDWWVTDRLRLGLKAGYQETRIADGEKAIDLMDRAAGKHFFITDAVNPNFDPDQEIPVSEYVAGLGFEDIPDGQRFFAFEDWRIHRPFPTFPSSCILPEYLFNGAGDTLAGLGGPGGGNMAGCGLAYQFGFDPVLSAPYVPNPTEADCGEIGDTDGITICTIDFYEDYPGFNPEWAPNNGEGFAKDLGGNEFPNAPHYTVTVTGDYVIPLRGDWLATLHTDIYWQSKSWWRIFNDHEFNRIDDYFTMNLAAIFSNEVSGWDIMAYVKNVTDEDALTGAFLYSDDTALTTNVFLVEPRLAGIRVTKHWDGGGPTEWISRGGAALLGKEPGEPSPWELTLGGQLLRPKDSPNEIFAPPFISEFDPNIDPSKEQGEKLDWGDGREIVLTYAPENGWRFSLGYRAGQANGGDFKTLGGEIVKGCGGRVNEAFDPPCAAPELVNINVQGDYFTRTNYGLSDLRESEEHSLVDFRVGREVGLGGFLQGTASAGLRYAKFKSRTDALVRGTPDWQIPEACAIQCKYQGRFGPSVNNPSQHNEFVGTMEAEREFEGLGPVLTWEASNRLFGNDNGSHVDLDWSLSGGVLFGKQETSGEGYAAGAYFNRQLPLGGSNVDANPESSYSESFSHERDDDSIATVPTLGAELGLTYRIDGGSIGLGYSWERYYGVIDGGIEERKTFDRTIEGPYLKVTFGGGS